MKLSGILIAGLLTASATASAAQENSYKNEICTENVESQKKGDRKAKKMERKQKRQTNKMKRQMRKNFAGSCGMG